MLRHGAVLVLLVSFAGLAAAQGIDPEDEPAMAESDALPDGVRAGNSDSQLEGAESPDADLARGENPDAITEGAGKMIEAQAVNPDAVTTTSQDLTDLPQASVIDGQAAAASAPAAPLPVGCSQPAGNAGWSACLGAVSQQLAAARQQLSVATAEYSRSLTGNVQLGQARADIIQARQSARADVQGYSAMLASQVEAAKQAGVASSVTDPYEAPAAPGW